jgi:hypothetical protein
VAESNPTKRRTIGRDTIRSHLVLEVASELVDRPEWPYRQARINLREQGGETGPSLCSAATLLPLSTRWRAANFRSRLSIRLDLWL